MSFFCEILNKKFISKRFLIIFIYTIKEQGDYGDKHQGFYHNQNDFMRRVHGCLHESSRIMYVRRYLYSYVYMCMHGREYIYIYMCVCVCVCVYV